MALPSFIAPQLATLVDTVPPGEEWAHEIKFDGYRMQCRIEGGRVVFCTREGQDWTPRFQPLVRAAAALPLRQAVLDGEVVAMDEAGISDFQLLQNVLRQHVASSLVYYAFDLLQLNGENLTSRPLVERKRLLQPLLAPAGKKTAPSALRYSEHWIGQGTQLLDQACAMGLEGIVSKRLNEPYRSGRSQSWLKIKCLHNQEFVIGGFTEPSGSRQAFGALLLGVYDDGRSLRYAGRVGTGFNQRSLRDLHEQLVEIIRASPPFVNPPRGSQAKGVRWVEPRLVCEVSFTGWTRDGVLRHPSFKGLREDKPAKKVRREMVKSIAPPETSANEGDSMIAGVRLTHPDRVLYPEQGITKRELANYYERIAPWILPHLQGRPLTLVRCPQGRSQQCFYQRNLRELAGVEVHPIRLRERGKTVSYISVDSLSGLIGLVQMGVLELHTWGSREPRLERPDRITFDLDPDPETPWAQLREAAMRIRAVLQALGLGAFVKTTGGKGLHVITPITPNRDWPLIKKFSQAIAESIVAGESGRYVATASKAQRRGKIFIDYLRNARSASAVCAYSPRAREGAPVSVPLDWRELRADVRRRFSIRTVPQRLSDQRHDPWRDYEAARKSITAKMITELQP